MITSVFSFFFSFLFIAKDSRTALPCVVLPCLIIHCLALPYVLPCLVRRMYSVVRSTPLVGKVGGPNVGGRVLRMVGKDPYPLGIPASEG